MVSRSCAFFSGLVQLSAVLLLSGCADSDGPTNPSAVSPSGESSDAAPLSAGTSPDVLTAQGGVAGQKVSLCHATGNGNYVLTDVSVRAEPAHRAHGDAAVGEPVPGQTGMEFGGDCSQVQTSSGPIRWTLNQVTFTDGGTAAGYFDFDASTGTVLGWDISVAGGNTVTFPPFNYNSSSVGHVGAVNTVWAPDGEGLVFLNPGTVVPRRLLRIDPVALLTNAGGVIPLSTTLNANIECFQCNPFRSVNFSNQPFVNGAPVPQP